MSHTEILVPRSARPVPWLARMRQQLRSFTRPPKNLSEITIADRYFSGGEPSAAGIYVSPAMAFTFSAVFDAVNQIASDSAKLPLNLRKRRKDGGSDLYEESKLYRLLKYEPNPEMGSLVFRRTITAHALTCEGGFAEIQRDGVGRPTALWPITPDRVTPFRERDARDRLGPLRYRIDGGRTILEAQDVLHIHGLGYDGYTGYSVIDKARQAIGLALAGEKFLGSFFGNGTRFGGVLSSDQDLDDDQKEEIRASINELHAKADKAFRLLILGAGFTFTEAGTSPKDTDMASIRDQQIEEVARFYRMPPHRLGLNKPGTVSYASVEMSNLDYYTGALLDWITIWEEELNRKLISPLESRQQFIKHNANAFLRGDIKSRYEALGIARDKGIINADEWRELEDMNPQEGGTGKVYLVQAAQIPVDQLIEKTSADIEKVQADTKKALEPTPPPVAPAPAPAPDATETKALRERLELAEAFAAQARSELALERDQRIAAEASGTASAAEVERLLEAERVAAVRAVTAELVLQERLADLAAVTTAHDALTAALTDAETARATAEQSAQDAKGVAAEAVAQAARALEDVEQATERARLAAALAEEAQRSAEDARAAGVLSAAQMTEAEGQAVAARLVAEAAEVARTEAQRQAVAAAAAQATAEAEARRLAQELVDAQARVAEEEVARVTSERAAAEAGALATAAQEAIAAERTAIQAEMERLAAEQRGEARQALDAVQASLAAAQAETASARADAAAAERRAQADAEALGARLSEETAARERAESERRQIATAEDAGLAATIAAHRTLVVDIMRRMVERETDRARRAQATPDKLRRWVETFYEGHEDLLRTALLPAVRIHLAFIRSDEDPVEAARWLAQRHVAESQGQLLAMLDGDAEEIAASLPALLSRWDQERATTIADRLMQKELDYARSR